MMDYILREKQIKNENKMKKISSILLSFSLFSLIYACLIIVIN